MLHSKTISNIELRYKLHLYNYNISMKFITWNNVFAFSILFCENVISFPESGGISICKLTTMVTAETYIFLKIVIFYA